MTMRQTLTWLLILLHVGQSIGKAGDKLGLRAEAISSDSIRVTWKNLFAPSERNDGRFIVGLKKREATHQVELSAGELTYNCTGLSPFTAYPITLTYLSANGLITELWATTTVTTWPSAGRSVTNVRFPQTKSRSIMVAWSAPDKPDGIIKLYKVFLMSREQIKRTDVIAPSTETTFKNLFPNTAYTIKIQIENSPLNGHGGGVGKASRATVTTLDDVNLRAVAKRTASVRETWNNQPSLTDKSVTTVKFSETTTSSFKVSWQAPFLSHVEIKTYKVESINTNTGKKVAVEVLTNETTFTGLDPSTTYNISIMTENKPRNGHSVGLGPPVTATVTTLPLEELDLRAEAISSDSIRVTWKNLIAESERKDGSFIVAITNGYTTIQTRLSGDKSTKVFTGLLPFKFYPVSLLYMRGKAELPENWARTTVTTWPSAGQRVTNVRFSQTTSYSYIVSWSAPDKPYGIIKLYKVLLRSGEVRRTIDVTAPKTETTFKNLYPNTAYTIIIQTENFQLNGQGGGIGKNSTATVTTLDDFYLRAVAMGADSIRVTWNKQSALIKDNSRPLIILLSDGRVESRYEIAPGGWNQYFRNLSTFTNYTATLICFLSTDSDTSVSFNVSVTTLPAAGQRVTNVRFSQKTSHSFMVSWSAPDKPLGIITWYKVFLSSMEKNWRNDVIAPKTETTFKNLYPNTKFTITIQTHNSPLHGKGGSLGEAVTVTVTTLDDVYLRAVAMGTDIVRVTWKKESAISKDNSRPSIILLSDGRVESRYQIAPGSWEQYFRNLSKFTTYTATLMRFVSTDSDFSESFNVSVTTWSADHPTCGRRRQPPITWSPLNMTRRVTAPNSWPWTLGLYSSIRGGYPYCGATLIASDWIITAAHCVELAMNCITAPVGEQFSYKALTSATLFARIGDHDLNKREATEMDRVVRSIIIHPQYKRQSGNREHDVALLHLAKPVPIGEEIDVICLPQTDSTVSSSTECVFAGWGPILSSRLTVHQVSPVLTEGRVMIESKDVCKTFEGKYLPEGQACLATRNGNPCWGDSGAGVYCPNAQGQWSLYGLINRGKFLCEGQYATSTFIPHHVDWIRKTVTSKDVI